MDASNMCQFLFIFTSLISVATPIFAKEETSSYHRSFNRRELAETFGVNHHDNVPKYASTKVHGLKHGLEQPESDASHSFSIKAFGKDFNISVYVNKNVVADTHTTEFVDEDGSSKKYDGVLGVYTLGVVEYDPNSHVALQHTGRGISGSIRTSNDLYFINPLPHRMKNEKDNHIVFRASDIPGDHIKTFSDADKELVTESNTHRRTRRSTSLPKKTIELLIAADYKMYDFYGEDLLPSYMLAVANIISGYFRDTSLSYPMDVVLVRSTIFKTDILKGKTVGDLLGKFSGWCNENNNFDDTSEDHFDVALLMTRDGCYDGCRIEGLAYINVACKPHRAQGVAKDRGFMSTTTLAHEFGHILGAGHDGESACADGINIMASGGVGGGSQAIKWSSCSSKQMEATMRSSRSTCYDDTPPKKKTDSKFQLYGTVYSADQQCNYMYGFNYQKCPQYQDRMCRSLYCNPKGTNVCESIFSPALHGTSCEKNKWCIDGVCVPDGSTARPPVHGGWSAWSEYTTCNKPCDIGVQWRIRHCNNPEPSNGGDWCDKTGNDKSRQHGHYRTCNTQNCQATTYVEDKYYPDRDEQCNALKTGSTFCKHCKGIAPCSLWCGGSTWGTLQGYAKSGTYCNTDVFQKGVCVNGACVEVGCDRKLNSGRIEDRCDVCNGDGSSCSLESGTDDRKFKRELRKRSTFFITTIPVNATKVIVQENARTVNFLACKIGDASSFAITLPSYGETIKLDGAVLIYKLTAFPNQDKITIDGILKVPVHIYYTNKYYYGDGYGIHWSYTLVGITAASQVQVKWTSNSWSDCNKTCAGGWKARTVQCRRKDDNTPAKVELCEALSENKPAVKMECQTQNCPAIWYTSEWSVCTRSCGTGEKKRTISCAELSKTGSYLAVSESKCTNAKPTSPTTEKCNDFTCPATWDVLTPYTACSKSCDGGMSTRQVGCRRLDRGTKLLLVKDLECIGMNISKPETTETCNKDIACPGWVIEYSECSASCGAGVKRPNIVCTGGGSEKKVLPFEKCDQGTKPVSATLTLKDCNMGVCIGHKWSIKEGACSTTCGDGLVSSTVYCFDIVTKREIEEFRCPALKKPTTPAPKPCMPGICPDVYVWRNDHYDDSCSKSCGGGVLLSQPYCVQLKSNNKTSRYACDAGTKPKPLTKSCNVNKCPPYDWIIRYTDCSLTCGKGVEVGTAACKTIADGLIVDHSKCDPSTKPRDDQKACELAVCPDPALFSWVLKRVGCNVTCGRGVIVKEIICYRKDSEMKYTKVSPRHCAGKPEPAISTEECVLSKCPPTHQWNKLNQYCSSTYCGKGYNVLEIRCTVIGGTDIAEHKFCASLDTPVTNCDRHCSPVNANVSPAIYPIGCFADTQKYPKVPTFYKALPYNSSNALETIKQCYEGAKKKGEEDNKKYTFFALQSYGDCWLGDSNTLNTYNAAGESHDCSGGTGEQNANYVYHIESPLPTTDIYVVKHGCAVASGTSNGAPNDFFLHRIISICGPVSYKNNDEYFGGDSQGNCLTSDVTQTTMASSAFSTACLPEKDGVMQYHVFAFVKR